MNLLILGKVIRERRQQLSLNQETLSKQSKVAIKTIHSIELGKGNPSIKTLTHLLEVLGLEVIIIERKQ